MTKEEARKAIIKVLHGIDETETESEDGWWEVDAGAEYGARKKAEILAIIDSINEV